MQTVTTTTELMQRAIEVSLKLGRKFEDNDLVHPTWGPKLREAACDYLRGYKGDFEYVLDLQLKHQQLRKMSNGQLRGALNVMMSDYRRDEARKVQAETNAATPTRWIGEAGDKVATTVTVAKLTTKDSDYGVTTIVKMTDTAGNALVWFASSDLTENPQWANPKALREGGTYILKGTVKAQNEWMGKKETVLTRCKLVAVDGGSTTTAATVVAGACTITERNGLFDVALVTGEALCTVKTRQQAEDVALGYNITPVAAAAPITPTAANDPMLAVPAEGTGLAARTQFDLLMELSGCTIPERATEIMAELARRA